MIEYNHYRGSIYHCFESGGEVEPIYIEDGLMVVDVDSGTCIFTCLESRKMNLLTCVSICSSSTVVCTGARDGGVRIHLRGVEAPLAQSASQVHDAIFLIGRRESKGP